MTRPNLQFWFEFASTYSYPTAERIIDLTQERGIELTLRPFLLGPIFAAQGWDNSPFNIYPAKGRYMWRDLERICEHGGLPLQRPSVFPRNGLNAARIAAMHAEAPWCAEFVRRVYRANFVSDSDISSPEVLQAILEQLPCEASTVVTSMTAPQAKDLLRSNTEEAAERGIFGSPSFTVREELFWGNDRLEDALRWAERSGYSNSGRVEYRSQVPRPQEARNESAQRGGH